jgi:hypothetical protein
MSLLAVGDALLNLLVPLVGVVTVLGHTAPPARAPVTHAVAGASCCAAHQ